MSSVGASKSDCVQFAEGIAKAYVRAIAQKPDEYAQINFQCTTDDFPNIALSGRTAEIPRSEKGHTQAVGHSFQDLSNMTTELNKAATSFMTASITVGREFSNAMYNVLCSALKEFDHSQNNVSLGRKEAFYQAFRTEMSEVWGVPKMLDNGEIKIQKVQPGVIETLGANPELGKIKGDDGFLKKVKEANPKNTAGTCFKIEEECAAENSAKSQNVVKINKKIGTKDIPFDPGFIEAARKQAARDNIVIMCGVNPDSLGNKGVLVRSDRYAPKPMTCHAKSSYFGFTKGLVPVNQKFSRRNIAVNEEEKKKSDKDVDYSKEHGGQEYPLEVSVEGDATNLCPVYQGEFSQGEIRYRFQVAMLNGKDNISDASEVEKAVIDAIKNKISKILMCGRDDCGGDDKGWDVVDLESLNENIAFDENTIERTLVLGPQKNSGKGPEKESEESASVTDENNTKISSTIVNENMDKERYYVSDYDVFAIAHRDSQSATTKTSNGQSNAADGVHNRYKLLGESGGEVADPADVATINAINKELREIDNTKKHINECKRKGLYEEKTFNPIQHAAAATLHFNNPAAKPAYPLFAIEENHVIAIKDHKALAAYLYCLENPRHGEKGQQTCLINSALSNILAEELVKLSKSGNASEAKT